MTASRGDVPVACNLIGQNGNIFNLIATARRCLRRAGRDDDGAKMQGQVMTSSSYDEALMIILQYVREGE